MNKMRSRFLFLLALLLCFTKYVIAQKAHPYLFYTPQRVSRLKERIKTDTLLANNWNAIKQRCDDWLSKEKGGNMEQLAFAYNMTGENRYADRAKMLLLEMVNKPYWDGMDDRTPRWNAGLATSHTDWTTAVTFDAIYNSLSKEERKEIAAKIVKLGIEPAIADWVSKDKRIQSLNNMDHNWWAAIVFEAGIASLAVMNEVPEAKNWAAGIMENSKEWFAFNGSVLENKPANFDPVGGFYESVSYASYGLSEYLLFRVAWSQSVGAVSMPYDGLLQHCVDWFINSCYPRSKGQLLSLNFGDSNDFATADRPAKLLIALGLGKDYYYWYLKETAKNQFGEDLNVHTPMGYCTSRKISPCLPARHCRILLYTAPWVGECSAVAGSPMLRCWV